MLLWTGEGPDGAQKTSGYVSKDGKILSTPCSGVTVVAEAAEANSTTGPIKSFTVEIPFGNDAIVAHLIVGTVLANTGDVHVRGSGTIRGGVKSGDDEYSGIAAFEYLTSFGSGDFFRGATNHFSVPGKW